MQKAHRVFCCWEAEGRNCAALVAFVMEGNPHLTFIIVSMANISIATARRFPAAKKESTTGTWVRAVFEWIGMLRKPIWLPCRGTIMTEAFGSRERAISRSAEAT